MHHRTGRRIRGRQHLWCCRVLNRTTPEGALTGQQERELHGRETKTALRTFHHWWSRSSSITIIIKIIIIYHHRLWHIMTILDVDSGMPIKQQQLYTQDAVNPVMTPRWSTSQLHSCWIPFSWSNFAQHSSETCFIGCFFFLLVLCRSGFLLWRFRRLDVKIHVISCNLGRAVHYFNVFSLVMNSATVESYRFWIVGGRLQAAHATKW